MSATSSSKARIFLFRVVFGHGALGEGDALWWQALARRAGPASAGRGAYASVGLAPPKYRVHSDAARTVALILYYVAFMIGGAFAAYFVGLLVEYEWGTHVSLIVFLAVYFFSLWVAWVLAVRVTRPRDTENYRSTASCGTAFGDRLPFSPAKSVRPEVGLCVATARVEALMNTSTCWPTKAGKSFGRNA